MLAEFTQISQKTGQVRATYFSSRELSMNPQYYKILHNIEQ